jgi:hypothetical protein
MSSDATTLPPKFVIVTLPRSGSYHLVSLLNSAPDIVCHGEVFKRDTIELAAPHLAKLGLAAGDVAERDAKAAHFLKRLRAQNGRKVFGFKMFMEHATRVPALAQVLRDPEWRKVVLRRNPVESYASLLRAQRTGIWMLKREAADAAPREHLDAPVTFDARSYAEHMRMCEWFDRQVDDATGGPGNAALALDYREVVDRSALARVLSFVGSSAPAASLTSDREKQFSRPFAEGFTNWGELAAHARAQGHGAFLDAAA